MDEHPPVPVAATWRAEDFVALEAYNGLLEIDLFAGERPPILVDTRGYDQMAFLGEVGNPLAAEAVAAFEEAQRQAERVLDGATKPDLAERAIEARILQDKILAAICRRPVYCTRDRLINGKPPAGQFWYGSFTPEQRRLLADFFYNGAEALKPFRPPAKRHEPAPRSGGGLSPAPEPDPNSAGASVPAVVAGQRGADLAPPPDAGGGEGGGDAPRGVARDAGNGAYR